MKVMKARTSNSIQLIVALVAISLPARALAGGVQIVSTTGSPGGTVNVEVKLTGEAAELIAGTQNDIGFNKDQLSIPAVAANGNKPDCSVNPAINKKIDGSETFGFGFLKGTAACDPASGECDAIRAIVLSTDNVDAIAAGSVLYTCHFVIKEGVTAGTQVSLTVPEGSAIGSDPAGQRLTGFAGQGGVIAVGGGGCTGDCNGDSMVDIGDLQKGLNIFFGAPVADCPSFDKDNSNSVDIGELQLGLNNFFGSCQ